MVVFSNRRLGPGAELLVSRAVASELLREVAAAAGPAAQARWEHELVRWLERCAASGGAALEGPRDATRGGVNGPASPGQRERENPLSDGASFEGPRDEGPRDEGPRDEGPRDATRDEGPRVEGPRDATRGGVNGPALPGQRGRESPLSIDVADIAWTPEHFERQRRFLVEAIQRAQAGSRHGRALTRWCGMVEAHPRESVSVGRRWQWPPEEITI